MAIGDDATAAGYPLVPNTGSGAEVKYGGREINRTRDYVAQVKALIPTSKALYRVASGITSGTTVPLDATGTDGDVYFRTL